MLFWRIVILAIYVVAVNCEFNASDIKAVVHYLKKYGYLQENAQKFSAGDDTTVAMKRAIMWFQKYYKLPGNGELNELTLQLMNTPRCGVEDMSERSIGPLLLKWPKTYLTWNFHGATGDQLTTAQAAFDLWAANSSLTFARDIQNPNILISFRDGFHPFLIPRYGMCSDSMDGPNGVVAHAYFPTGDKDYVSEIHMDNAERWHITLDKNPPGTYHMLQTLTHEIGHALGLRHSPNEDSVMFAFVPKKSFPTKLSYEDILTIQHLYGLNVYFPVSIPITTTIAPMTTTTRATTTRATTTRATTAATTIATDTKFSKDDVETDLCALQRVDHVLVFNSRIYVVRKRHVWSIDVNGKTYRKPFLLTNYINYLPVNFTLSAAYQAPSGDLVLFVDNKVYLVNYPSLALVPTWPRYLSELGFPSNARINAAVNTNRGRTFVIYDDQFAAEMNECSMKASQYFSIQAIFPGIPSGISTAFRFIDGNLYFFSKRQFYKFNEFTKAVTTIGGFEPEMLGVTCPRDGLLLELRNLLSRFVRIDALMSNRDDTLDDIEEEKSESTV